MNKLEIDNAAKSIKLDIFFECFEKFEKTAFSQLNMTYYIGVINVLEYYFILFPFLVDYFERIVFNRLQKVRSDNIYSLP